MSAVAVLAWWGGSIAWDAGMRRLAQTSWAELKRIEVIGLSRLPEFDVLKAAAVDDSANLMELDLDAISVRVSQVAGIRRARIYRRLPGRLVINVEERFPIAAVVSDELVLVDEFGSPFPPVYGGEVLDIPVLTGEMEPVVGNHNFRTLSELAVRIKCDYPHVYEHLGEINMEESILTLRLRHGGALIKTKETVNKELLDDLERFLSQRHEELPACLDYVDMRFPAMIVTGTKG